MGASKSDDGALQALLPPVSRAPACLRLLCTGFGRSPGGWWWRTGRLTSTGPPAIFTTLGRHPRLFRGWLLYSAHPMPFGTLPRRETELVILRVAWLCAAAYEWWQHVPFALRTGLRPMRPRLSRTCHPPPTSPTASGS